MADESKEVEGVRILGAKEAGDTATTSSSKNVRSTKNPKPLADQAENVELPHWSEAPTGEVPAVSGDIKGDGWEALTGSQPVRWCR